MVKFLATAVQKTYLTLYSQTSALISSVFLEKKYVVISGSYSGDLGRITPSSEYKSRWLTQQTEFRP